jgi:DNA-binding MarR family transcriptional regulator
MQRKRLIRKRRDRERKNVWRIALTDRGRDASIASTKREVLHDVMAVLSADDKLVLEQQLRRLRSQALKALIVEPTLELP